MNSSCRMLGLVSHEVHLLVTDSQSQACFTELISTLKFSNQYFDGHLTSTYVTKQHA